MIVKVQQSLYTNAPYKMMLIYNEDKSVVEEYGMTTQIEKALKGRPKAYFNAHHVQEGKVIELVIGEEVEAQDW